MRGFSQSPWHLCARLTAAPSLEVGESITVDAKSRRTPRLSNVSEQQLMTVHSAMAW